MNADMGINFPKFSEFLRLMCTEQFDVLFTCEDKKRIFSSREVPYVHVVSHVLRKIFPMNTFGDFIAEEIEKIVQFLVKWMVKKEVKGKEVEKEEEEGTDATAVCTVSGGEGSKKGEGSEGREKNEGGEGGKVGEGGEGESEVKERSVEGKYLAVFNLFSLYKVILNCKHIK